MRLSRGYLELMSVRGAPVRVHVLAPVVWFLFSRQAPGSPLGAMLALAFLVFVHELGHAALVWRFGARVVRLDLLPFGGECEWLGSLSPLQTALVAWGGVWAQLLVLAAAWFFLGQPAHPGWLAAGYVLTITNLAMVVLNLLPVAPLDGALAWRAIPLGLGALATRRRAGGPSWWARWRSKRKHLRVVSDDERS